MRASHEHPSHCPHCAAPLDALARRLGRAHCGAAACRHRAEALALDLRWQAVALQATQAAKALQPARRRAAAAVIWLNPATREMAAVDDALRAQLAARWRARVQDGERYAYAGTDSAGALPASAHLLCAQCAGACCAHGAGHHAFIDADVIERWQAAHPGASTEDAIAGYLGRLPAEHVQGGCGFQGPQGCVLPRALRADICNRYMCEPLQTLGQALAQNPAHAAVLLTRDGRRLERAALLHQGRLQALDGLPGPDELPR